MNEGTPVAASLKTFSLSETKTQHGKVFDLAIKEPVIITKQSRPSHVILSYDDFDALANRVRELEDAMLGKAANDVLARSKMMGSDAFTAALESFIHAET